MYRKAILLLPVLMAMPALAAAAGHTSTPTVATSSAGTKGGAPGGYKQPVPAFKKVDTNGDHEIEWKEAKSVGVPKAIFKRFDYHHDGKLNLTEWKMVKVAMIGTTKMPATGSKSLPRVPAGVVKKIHAPAYGTVTGTAGVPTPSTGGHGGAKASLSPAREIHA